MYSLHAGPSRVVVLLIAILFPAAAWGDALATGGMQVDTDWEFFLARRGEGGNCVNVLAAPAQNPPQVGDLPCILRIPFGFGFLNRDGRGNAAPKPQATPIIGVTTYTNTVANEAGRSIGSGSWTYELGDILDTAAYHASSNISAPRGSRTTQFQADAKAFDPIEFEASTGGVFGLAATLQPVTLVLEDDLEGGYVGVGADYYLDEAPLFVFSLLAPSGFRSIADLQLRYESVLGAEFDVSMRANILANLDVDPGGGTVELRTSLTLFPRTEIVYLPGTHRLSGGFGTTAELRPLLRRLGVQFVSAPAGNGRVTSEPAGIDCIRTEGGVSTGTCTAWFGNGTIVTLTATPDPGHGFDYWWGDAAGCGTSPDCMVTMTQDLNAAAVFQPPQAVRVAFFSVPSGAGTVTSSPPGIDCTRGPGGVPVGTCEAYFAYGSAVMLTATPSSSFERWGGMDGQFCGKSPICGLVMTRDRHVNAGWREKP